MFHSSFDNVACVYLESLAVGKGLILVKEQIKFLRFLFLVCQDTLCENISAVNSKHMLWSWHKPQNLVWWEHL